MERASVCTPTGLSMKALGCLRLLLLQLLPSPSTNMLCGPVINLIGMGMGLLIWGSTNMLIGWATGTFGLFDLDKGDVSTPASAWHSSDSMSSFKFKPTRWVPPQRGTPPLPSYSIPKIMPRRRRAIWMPSTMTTAKAIRSQSASLSRSSAPAGTKAPNRSSVS